MTQLDEVTAAPALRTEVDHRLIQVGALEDTLDLLAVTFAGPRIGLERPDYRQSTVDVTRLEAKFGFDDEALCEVRNAAEVERVA